MAKKQQRVPGMREITPNREMRRHPERTPAEDEPTTRDDAAESPAADTENVVNGRKQKKTNVANQYR